MRLADACFVYVFVTYCLLLPLSLSCSYGFGADCVAEARVSWAYSYVIAGLARRQFAQTVVHCINFVNNHLYRCIWRVVYLAFTQLIGGNTKRMLKKNKTLYSMVKCSAIKIQQKIKAAIHGGEQYSIGIADLPQEGLDSDQMSTMLATVSERFDFLNQAFPQLGSKKYKVCPVVL